MAKSVESAENIGEDQKTVIQVLELAEEQGYVTAEDLLNMIPEVELKIDLLEDIYDALRSAGIPYVDEKNKLGIKRDGDSPDESDEEEEPEKGRAVVDAIDAGDTFGAYLSNVSRVDLLTRDEEIELSKRIERGTEARQELVSEPTSAKRAAELRHLIEDGMAAREHLILANLRLVFSVAKKHRGRGVPLLDLVQEGHIGLMRAVKKYDYKRGYKFSTYATWWIRQAVTRAVADNGRTIRLPVHLGERIGKMHRAWHRLTQELGRDPTPEEIAKELDEKPVTVKNMLRVAQRTMSLEKPVGEDEDGMLGDFIEDDEAPAPEEVATENLLSEHLQEVLEELPPREVRVLKLRYGLQGGRIHTLNEVGSKMGITRERVRQIEAQALRRLRNPRLRTQLGDYIREW